MFLAVWILLLVAGRERLFRDPGTFWHTAVGDQILRSHRLIRADSFTFTFTGRPWIAHQWLGECIMAVVHRVAGLDGQLLLSAALLASVFASVGCRWLRVGMHWSIVAVIVALLIAAASSHFHIRPHLGTIVLLACVFGLLCDVEARRTGVGRLALLIPAFVLWANTHGGMMGGLATLVLAFAGWTLWWSFSLPSPLRSLKGLAAAGLIVIACGLAAFVNPYGSLLPRTWREIMDSPVLPKIIQEHAPLNAARPDGMAVIVVGILYLLLLVGTLPRWPRVTWLLPIIWYGLALNRVRHAPLFALTAGIAAADLFSATCWARWLLRAQSDLYRPPQAGAAASHSQDRAAVLAASAVVLTAFFLQCVGLPVPLVGRGWAHPDPQIAPAGLLERLRRAAPADGRAVPIFNEYAYGGFLIYHAHFDDSFPAYRVFIDDRCELFGDAWLEHVVRAERQGTAEWVRAWEKQYGRFPLALVHTGSGYDHFFSTSGEWARVGLPTDGATLYVRTSAASARPVPSNQAARTGGKR